MRYKFPYKDIDGVRYWPIEELFSRRTFTPGVQARMRRLMGDWIEEGSEFRGRYVKPMSWRRAKKLMSRGKHPWQFRLRGGKGIWHVSLGPYDPEREKEYRFWSKRQWSKKNPR